MTRPARIQFLPFTFHSARLLAMPALLVLLATLPGRAPQAAELSVSDAWARATPPGARTAAAYLAINGGEQADRLLGGTTDAARELQIHTHVHSGGMMSMQQIPALDIPAGGQARLSPGADHLMLIGLTAPLVAGQNIQLELKFEHAGTVNVTVPVRDAR